MTSNLDEPTMIMGTRPHVKGKFLYIGNEKFYMKGVTYGTFAPGENDVQFPSEDIVAKDFEQMAAYGFNAVRTYTVPPLYLLNKALEFGLKVMVGLPWEQHITFLDNPKQAADITKRIEAFVKSCMGHPAILCFAIGNEIPAGIVRWHGKKKVEQWLRHLYHTVKQIDPGSLVTYVNFPTTEYLDLQFLDFYCFNIYLESPEKLGSYIARLHNLSGEQPLVLAEIGLDSMRNGEEKQAEVLQWQVETIYGKGCAGMFVFAWTDEWWRGGFDIEDWDFGLVDRQRQPKKALETVSNAMRSIPVPVTMDLPYISVVICTYNGSSTITDTLDALQANKYPAFEVIVVNDGSKDHVAEIAAAYPVKLISTKNRGLSNARNTGMQHAVGEIVAYIDDDAYPDPEWLYYLAYAFRTSHHDCIGGPNLVPPEDGALSLCVANAPGGPVHVLETDEIAEHVPGCNMAFRKSALIEIGGFDPIYRAAGDDVDVCWRIQQRGGTVGFHPSALVWHHRRNSIKAYWKQQKGYGKAEALLEKKWPEKYNGFGHLTWAGRIYGNGFTIPIKLKKDKIFFGTWGTALFQSVYQGNNGIMNALPLMPEWYFIVVILGLVSLLGVFYSGLFWTVLLFAASVIVLVAQAIISAYKNTNLPKAKRKTSYYSLIVLLHLIQPVARLYGRLMHGLTPWRKKEGSRMATFHLPFSPKVFSHWSEEKWLSSEQWLEAIEAHIISSKTRIKRGGNFDSWDFTIRNGIISTNRMLLSIEEHGANKQYVRLRSWSTPSLTTQVLSGFLFVLAIITFIDKEWGAFACIGIALLLVLAEYIMDSAVLFNKLQLAFAKAAPVKTSVDNDFKKEQKKVVEKESPIIQHAPIIERVAFTASRFPAEIIKNNYLANSPIATNGTRNNLNL